MGEEQGLDLFVSILNPLTLTWLCSSPSKSSAPSGPGSAPVPAMTPDRSAPGNVDTNRSAVSADVAVEIATRDRPPSQIPESPDRHRVQVLTRT